MKLSNKVAIVTGSGRGIGRAIALEMAREGAKIVIADLLEDNAQGVAREIEAMGGESLPIKVDITDKEQVYAMVSRTMERFYRVDVLVNNAGWDKAEPFIKSTEETWDKLLAINLKGPIRCCRAVLDQMISQQSGRIINISSDAGRVGSSGEAVYSAAKGGIIAFTKTLAREMARSGIRVNCLCPGPSNTPLFAEIALDNPKLTEALKRAIPLGRLGEPEDLAGAVAFLASDAAEYITGQTISVSGGLTMS
ncbi:MAG: SDR family NAD(P)-dependent oxidoreductase [Bacillota bacterium]